MKFSIAKAFMSTKVGEWAERNVKKDSYYPALAHLCAQDCPFVLDSIKQGKMPLLPPDHDNDLSDEVLERNFQGLDMPVRFVDLPEKVLLLPIPSWFTDSGGGGDPNYSTWLFESEARELIKEFTAKLQAALD